MNPMTPLTRQERIEIFRGKGILRNWYWRHKAANNQIIAQSEGYVSRYNAERAARRIYGTRLPVVVKTVGR